MRFQLRATCLTALLTLASVASQAEVIGTLAYVQKEGAAAASDVIDLWVRLTLSAKSEALAWGAPAGSTQLSYSSSATWYCGSSFGGCGEQDAYQADMASGAGSWAEFIRTDGFSLQPGQSRDFLLYNLTPTQGEAASGVYLQKQVGLGLERSYVDTSGTLRFQNLLSVTTPQCQTGQFGCGFTRTVTAVPEPSAVWLGLVGAFALTVATRARRPRA